jgi:hypothetical protein
MTILALQIPSVALAEATPVTIAQLLSDPGHYRNAQVIVRGQIDNCIALSCNLCPEEMTTDSFDYTRCVVLEFDNFSGSRDDVETPGVMEQAFRFATVTITAEFDPSMLLREVIPGGRGIGLVDARVQQVHSRRSARNGLVGIYDYGKLVEPPPGEIGAMREAFLRDGAQNFGKLQTAIFWVDVGSGEQPAEKIEASGLACVCIRYICAGQWPKRLFSGFESPANPFQCDLLVKKGGKWWPMAWH